METLRRHSHFSRQGVSMFDIGQAARSIGFNPVGLTLSFEDFVSGFAAPCILYWNQNHFVVCYAVKKRRGDALTLLVSDPASQRLSYGEREFRRCWLGTECGGKGAVLYLEPGDEFGKLEDSLPLEGKSFLSFTNYFSPYRQMLAQLLLAMFLGSIVQLVLPFLSQVLIDQGVEGNRLDVITLVLAAQLAFFVATMSMDYIRSLIMLHMNSRIDISLISDFLMKITAMPLRFFDTRMTGDILQRIGDHSRIKGFLLGNSMRMFFSVLNFMVFLLVLAFYNSKVLCMFLAGNSLYVVWVVHLMRYRRELDIKRFNISSREQSQLIQMVQGMQDIKLNNCERDKRWEWERIQVRLFKVGLRGVHVGVLQQSGMVFFSQSTQVLIYYIAARSVVEGSMTMGMMMSLAYILGQVSAPISDFIGFAQSLQDAKISLERLNEIHSMPDEEQGIEKKLLQIPPCHDISINHLSFSYGGTGDALVLKDVSLTIPEHKVTAIVGASGSGKTTLIKLLQGFYVPTSGDITVGGTSLDSINPHVWRGATGSVMQDSFIFSDTIASNIALVNADMDAGRMKAAASMAQIADFIESLPLGYSTVIGMEGIGLSQGQRQRILIARAIYKNPEYMFLDEATNSLDAINESYIMESLDRFYEGRTVVICAHRLSTVRNADQIVVMEGGKVVEVGDHASLMGKRGFYYELVKMQIGRTENG